MRVAFNDNKRYLLLLSVRFGAMTTRLFLPNNRMLILELLTYHITSFNPMQSLMSKNLCTLRVGGGCQFHKRPLSRSRIISHKMSAQCCLAQDAVLTHPTPRAKRGIAIREYHDQLLGKDMEGGGGLPFKISLTNKNGHSGDRSTEIQTGRSSNSYRCDFDSTDISSL